MTLSLSTGFDPSRRSPERTHDSALARRAYWRLWPGTEHLGSSPTLPTW